ncbi:MAG: hypothetical protein JWP32_2185 [Schumannella sp.]|nr:hypothetical protein [Schumannella sp.]
MTHLSDESRAALQALAALDSAEATRPLDRLAGIRGLISALENDPATLTAVRDALDAGAGWDEIAASAGLGLAAAKWRWQGSDAEIAARHEAGRKRAARPSAKPTDLPGLSVAEAAAHLGISVQGVYQRVTRGLLKSETVTLEDGRRYKRIFPE